MTEQNRKQQIISWVVTGILLALGFYNQLAQIKGWAHFEIGDAELTKYVTWFYELIVGVWAFWTNNNITTFAQLCQVLLDKLKEGIISSAQVKEFLENPTVQMVAQKVQDKDFNPELIEVLLTNEELQTVAQAELSGKELNINIIE